MRLRRRTAFSTVIAAAALVVPAAASSQVQTDRESQECQDCPMMVAIPAGRLVMGSPAGEQGRFDTEGPQHEVSIKAFALGKYDVTSREFTVFLQDTGY